MGKTFPGYNLGQPLLLLLDVRQRLAEEHLVLFVLDVVKRLGRSQIMGVKE